MAIRLQADMRLAEGKTKFHCMGCALKAAESVQQGCQTDGLVFDILNTQTMLQVTATHPEDDDFAATAFLAIDNADGEWLTYFALPEIVAQIDALNAEINKQYKQAQLQAGINAQQVIAKAMGKPSVH